VPDEPDERGARAADGSCRDGYRTGVGEQPEEGVRLLDDLGAEACSRAVRTGAAHR
jgi:hypothetical protein